MRRRIFIAGVVSTTATWPLAAIAQQPGNSVTRAFDHSHVNTGWTVGFGTEGKLLIPGWTYKIESLYMDLGTLDATSVTSASPAVLTGVMGQVTTHTHFTDAILRAGLNYQFH
jgi:outer membrane immunogenic protein